MPGKKNIPPPFSCQSTPQVPELLNALGCTLAITTFQAGKVIFISAKNDHEIIQLPRTFHKPMGLAVKEDKLALAAKDEVILFKGSEGLAHSYPKKPGVYDMMYVPTAIYQSGEIDLHDVAWIGNDVYAVNTSFSCLVKLDPYHHFIPVWQPPFISALASEDRCHLNGMAVEGDKIRYVTAFGQGDAPRSWKDHIPGNGIIMDLEHNEVLAQDLAMPHSPRIYDGALFVLLSATGELIQVDRENGKPVTIFQKDGFMRGLAKYEDYFFIGHSKLRKNSSSFAKLPFSDKAVYSGISIVHASTGAWVGEIRYLASVDEIYDVQVIPGYARANVLNTLDPGYKSALITPNSTYWGRIE